MKRESFASRLGFLLVSAGCAIGIGNVWKFPYITGQYGGGVFVLFYLIFLVAMGAPVLTMELAVGRASRLSVIRGYRALEPKGSVWHLHGWACLAGNYLLMMFYTVVSGWMLDYCVKFLSGRFDRLDSADVAGVFDSMLASPAELIFYMGVTVAFGIIVCSVGIRKGVEKVTTVMMTCLLVLIIVLAIHSAALPGAREGLAFYLLPDFARAREAGLGNVIAAAMNQSFFTLSLGIAAMEIFGSYMSRDYTLGSEAVRICALDTFVAIVSGLIIFPACFSYGVEVSAGPSLIFIALPQVFIHMPMGWVWGSLFFLFMTFASFSTVIAVFENIIAICLESFGWSRARSALVNCCAIFVLSIPCALGFNVWSAAQLIGGRGVLDSEDFLVSNLLLPLGSLVFLLFCVARGGWGFEKYLEEANTGKGVKISAKLKWYFLIAVPALILVILVQGIV